MTPPLQTPPYNTLVSAAPSLCPSANTTLTHMPAYLSPVPPLRPSICHLYSCPTATAAAILKKINIEGYQIGTNKVFMPPSDGQIVLWRWLLLVWLAGGTSRSPWGLTKCTCCIATTITRRCTTGLHEVLPCRRPSRQGPCADGCPCVYAKGTASGLRPMGRGPFHRPSNPVQFRSIPFNRLQSRLISSNPIQSPPTPKSGARCFPVVKRTCSPESGVTSL